MGRMLVYSNPSAPEREDEYNRWYDDIHVPEICALENFVGAQRFTVSDSQPMGAPDFSYLAVYEFEGDAAVAVDTLMSAGASLTMSDAIDTSTARMVVVEEHADRYEP